MSTILIQAYLKAFAATSVGQACLAAVRVFIATLVGCWMHAGLPIPPSEHQLAAWVAVAAPAALSLVIGNYLGPWEKRYGRHKETRV